MMTKLDENYIAFSNGKETMDYLDVYFAQKCDKCHSIPLVMTDNQMPLLNGIDLAKYLDERRARGDINYFLTMVSADDNEVEDLKHAGIDLFVSKPLTHSKLIKIVKTH